MEELLEILEDIQPDVDFETAEHLIDDHLLDSLSIISLIAELEDAFDISIDAAEMTPENFNSAANLWKMVERLQEDA